MDLSRFLDAQQPVYSKVVAELKAGSKASHWMWFIFPQIDGLGMSAMAKRYAIGNLEEARAYLADPVLGARLKECVNLLLQVQGRSAAEIMGAPDDIKLRSCATLFREASAADSIFQRLLDKYFEGDPDPATLKLLTHTA